MEFTESHHSGIHSDELDATPTATMIFIKPKTRSERSGS